MRESKDISSGQKPNAAKIAAISNNIFVPFNAMVGLFWLGQQQAISLTNFFAEAAAEHANQWLGQYRQYVYRFPERRSNDEFEINVQHHHLHDKNGNVFEAVYAPVENAKKDLIFIFTGCRSRAIHWERQIAYLNSIGHPVFCCGSYIPRGETGFADTNYEMAKRLLLDKESVVHKLARAQNINVSAMAHSFGGYNIIALMKHEPQMLSQCINKILLVNSFMGSRNLNPDRIEGKFGRWAYLNGHAKRYGDSYNGEHLADIFFAHIHRIMGEPILWSSNGPPTHDQIIEMQTAADTLRDLIFVEGFDNAIKQMDIITLIGVNDSFSDTWTNKLIGKLANSRIKPIPAWHTPLNECPELCAPVMESLFSSDYIRKPRPEYEDIQSILAYTSALVAVRQAEEATETSIQTEVTPTSYTPFQSVDRHYGVHLPMSRN